MTTIIILVVVLLVVLAVGLWAVQRQRTARLRERFGPEYDRTLDRTGSRREAEQTLNEVVQRRDSLSIHPLTAQQREDWLQQWGLVQSRFVDAPADAVTTARELLPALMRDRGYPTEDFDDRATLLAADHPVVVAEYRAAEDAYQRHAASGGSSTEALRQALVHYRALFEALLDQDGDDARPAPLPDARGVERDPAPDAGGAVRSDADGRLAGPARGRHAQPGAMDSADLDADLHRRGGTR